MTSPFESRAPAPLWRAGAFLLAFLVAAIVWSGLRSGLAGGGLSPLPAELAAGAVYVAAIFGLAILFRRRLDGRPLSSMGLSSPSTRMLAGGALAGVGMVAAVVTLGAATGHMSAGVVAVEGPGPLAEALLASLAAMTAVGIAEEITFRGYLLQALGERWTLGVGTVASGLLFGVVHLFGVSSWGEALLMVLSALTTTVLLVASRVVTGSIWWAVAWHTAWNWASASLGLYGPPGQPVEVAVDGPWWWVGPPGLHEAGLLVAAVNAFAAISLIAYASRRGSGMAWGRQLQEVGTAK